MLRPVALWLLLLAPWNALAVETMRIAMGEARGEVRVSGRGLAFGQDSEETLFQPLASAQVTVRRRGARIEVNGAPIVGDAVRFRGGVESADAGVPPTDEP